MGAKPSIFTHRPPASTVGAVVRVEDRQPTDAERAYARAKARQAAQATFDAEQRLGKDDAPCE
jgi:hypothetical protein